MFPLICCCTNRSGTPTLPFFNWDLQVQYERSPDGQLKRSSSHDYAGVFSFPYDESRHVVCAEYWTVRRYNYVRRPGLILFDIETEEILCEIDSVKGPSPLQSYGPYQPLAVGAVPPGRLSSPKILTGGRKQKVSIHDAFSGDFVVSFEDSPLGTMSIVHVPEWNRSSFHVAGAEQRNGCVYEYDLEKYQKSGVFDSEQKMGVVRGLSAAKSVDSLYTVSTDYRVRMWCRRAYTVEEEYPVSSPPRCCYYSEDRSLIIIGMYDGVDVRDRRNLANPVSIFTHLDEISCLDQVDQEAFVSVSSQGGFGDSKKCISIWDEKGKVFRLKDSIEPSDICVFREEDEFATALVNERIAFVIEERYLSVRIQLVDGEIFFSALFRTF